MAFTAPNMLTRGELDWQSRDTGGHMAPPPDHDHNDHLSAQTIHDLRAPLTVIQGQAQMVARWVRRNDLADGGVVLDRLSVITAMVARLVVELDALRESVPPDGDSNSSGDDA